MTNNTQMAMPIQDFMPTFEPKFTVEPGMIFYNSGLTGFVQTGMATESFRSFNKNKKDQSGPLLKKLTVPCAIGRAMDDNRYSICPCCGAFLKKDGYSYSTVLHLPLGNTRMELNVRKQRYACTNPDCTYGVMEEIPFKDCSHKITPILRNYIEDLLSAGLTLKDTAYIAHVDKNVVKEIDKARLMEAYTEIDADGNRKFKCPTAYSKHLGIDEFKLHDGPVFATVILDLDTGHVLYLELTKKMAVVEHFMDWVGDDWMKHVEAVASDMNADFGRTFQNRYPHITIVYDRFHIIKNFNDKVVTEVRKDEYNRLMAEGKIEEARSLKGARYILMSKRSTLQEHDRTIGKVINPGSEIFGIPKVFRTGKLEVRYDELLRANRLFFTMDLVKVNLEKAYSTTDVKEMKKLIGQTIGICFATKNEHFKWFGRMLKNHLPGILSHAEYQLTSGIVEGTNRMIKTVSAKAYGFRDDEYFFLKIIDASNK